MKELNFWAKRSFARKDGSLGETLDLPARSRSRLREAPASAGVGRSAKAGRHLLHVNSRGTNGNNAKALLPRKVALLLTLRNSKVLERDSS